MVRNREFVSEKYGVDRTCAGASLKYYSTNNNNNNNNNNIRNTSLDRVNGCKQYQIMSRLVFKQASASGQRLVTLVRELQCILLEYYELELCKK